jgi:hypothetical protein
LPETKEPNLLTCCAAKEVSKPKTKVAISWPMITDSSFACRLSQNTFDTTIGSTTWLPSKYSIAVVKEVQSGAIRWIVLLGLSNGTDRSILGSDMKPEATCISNAPAYIWLVANVVLFIVTSKPGTKTMWCCRLSSYHRVRCRICESLAIFRTFIYTTSLRDVQS